MWGLYQFKGTEHFRYDAVMVEDNEKQQGWYTLDAKPGAGGNYQLSVAGQMGTDSFRSTTTVAPGQGIPLMQVAAMGPGAIILFSPVYMMFGGQQWQVGNEWTFSQEGETASFKVESECSHAGRDRTPGRLAQEQRDHAGHVRVAQRGAAACRRHER